jgi:hypothetical protein
MVEGTISRGTPDGSLVYPTRQGNALMASPDVSPGNDGNLK